MTFNEVLQGESEEYKLRLALEDLIYVVESCDKYEDIFKLDEYKYAKSLVN